MNRSEQLCEEMVLGLLADARDGHLSGEALSDKLGLSPASVFKQIDGLRAKGYQIESVPHRGYRLVAVPDRLTGLELGPLLSTHDLGRTVHAFDEVESTNDVARQLGEEGAAHGEIVVAESQRQGRGRRGRSWLSPPGANLLFSALLRPQLPAARAPELTLLAAVAVTEVLKEAGFEAEIKWPNDIQVHGRKVAGILTELSAEQDRIRFAVLGIGVNVNLPVEGLPAEIAKTATSLQVLRGEGVPRAFLLAALLNGLEGWLDLHQDAGFAPVRARWLELNGTVGRPVKIDLGDRKLEGLAIALAEDGALLVRDGGGMVHRVVAGDILA